MSIMPSDPAALAHPKPLLASFLDVDELDSALTNLLLWNFDAKQKAYLYPLLQFASIVSTAGQTPAMRLLGLQQQRQNITRTQILTYALLVSLGPFLYNSIKEWLRRHPNPPPSSNDTIIAHKAWTRKRYIYEQIVEYVDSLLPVWRFANILLRWCGQDHLKRMLLGMSLQQQQTNNEKTPKLLLQVDYAYRRWLFQEVSRVAKIWLIGYTSMDFVKVVKPVLRRYLMAPFQTSQQCPLCGRDPILVQAETNCGHSYCFACLELNQEDPFYCRICQSRVTDCKLL